MGFIDDIEWILEHTPKERQTALFSATMPKPIRKLAEKHLQDPEQVTIKVKAENSPNIRQRFIKVRQHEKRDMLTRLLEIEKFEAMLIFARTKNATMEIAEKLQSKGYPAEPLNGDMPQTLREKTVDRLKRGKINVLVATDVAARGLDVDRISHVLNYDAPFDLESYTHRIGRTGRAGREGDAIIFITNKEMRMLNAIERTLKVPCDQYVFPTLEEMNERREEEFFNKIEQGLTGNLDDYRKALQRYIEESGKDTLEVAASLAFLEAGKKALRYESMPTASSGKGRREDRRDRDRGDRRESPRREGRDRKSSRDDNLQSYRMEVGEFHGAQKGDIVGAIANEVGIDPQHMGKIRMFKDHSFIDLPKDMPREIFEALKTVWVQGHQMNISVDKGRPRPGGAGGKFRKGPGKGKRFGKGNDFGKKSKSKFRS
jgi:ATP-dependent RNA helicase DeaD